jgi:2'-5' RNA ligase
MTSPATVAGSERPRLFLALPLPAAAAARVVPWQERELRAGRVVPPRNLHVTLAFLGATPAGRLDDIVAELREAAATAERPVLTVARYRETRSVGMLVLDDRDGRAGALAIDLHGRLERLGVYERELRPWLAHLTVLRFRTPPRLRPTLPDLGEVSPSEAAVYMSVLRRSGAEYEILASAALGGN